VTPKRRLPQIRGGVTTAADRLTKWARHTAGKVVA
jgi:hypothetical protein